MLLLIITTFIILFIVSYPFFEILKSKFQLKSETKHSLSEINDGFSIIISVFNEEKYIEAKINELLNEDIWHNSNSEIIIVAAGSTDSTNNILEKFKDNKKVNAIILQDHLTKIESINLAVTKSKNGLLVFSDCRQKMEKKSINYLLNYLINSDYDVIAGTLKNFESEKSENVIRKIINQLNTSSAKNRNSMNIYGALYAIKKAIFEPIPNNILFDDLFVLAFHLSKHRRIIQIKEAIIYEVKFETYFQEERIQRLNRGMLLFITRYFKLIFKMKMRDLYHFIMSKYAKLLLPILILTTIIQGITIISKYCLSIYFMSSVFLILFLLIYLYFKKIYFKIFIHFLYFSLKAQFLFFFKGKRSTYWEKLKH